MVSDLPSGVRARVRHYCQGLGDCHLLRFPKSDGSPFWILIDCGVHTSVKGGADTIHAVARDIASLTSRIDVLVVTHEHWDHVSGFLSAEETFGGLDVGEVWMAWTEDPNDAQARRLDQFKGNALAALQLASSRLNGVAAPSPPLQGLRQQLDTVLGFSFGAAGERVRKARNLAAALGKGNVRYFDPAATQPLTFEAVPDLRVFVLGPPRDETLLGLTDAAGELYGFAAARAMNCAFGFGDGGAEPDDAAPFEPSFGLPLAELGAAVEAGAKGIDSATLRFARAHYFGPRAPSPGAGQTPPAESDLDQSWQRIDFDWLSVGSTLALQLDNLTNNTSLALAFEFADTGRVLLFAADAQLGNWLSWQDLKWTIGCTKVTGPDLLGRTVYYKVSHHGSENATPKGKGLEQMVDRDLAAFVPVNAEDAGNVGWKRMPFDRILEDLARRTAGRVIRADEPWIRTDIAEPGFRTPSGSIRGLSHGKALWVELDLA